MNSDSHWQSIKKSIFVKKRAALPSKSHVNRIWTIWNQALKIQNTSVNNKVFSFLIFMEIVSNCSQTYFDQIEQITDHNRLHLLHMNIGLWLFLIKMLFWSKIITYNFEQHQAFYCGLNKITSSLFHHFTLTGSVYSHTKSTIHQILLLPPTPLTNLSSTCLTLLHLPVVIVNLTTKRLLLGTACLFQSVRFNVLNHLSRFQSSTCWPHCERLCRWRASIIRVN